MKLSKKKVTLVLLHLSLLEVLGILGVDSSKTTRAIMGIIIKDLVIEEMEVIRGSRERVEWEMGEY